MIRINKSGISERAERSVKYTPCATGEQAHCNSDDEVKLITGISDQKSKSTPNKTPALHQNSVANKFTLKGKSVVEKSETPPSTTASAARLIPLQSSNSQATDTPHMNSRQLLTSTDRVRTELLPRASFRPQASFRLRERNGGDAMNKVNCIDPITPKNIRRQRRKEIEKNFGKRFTNSEQYEASTSSSEKDGCRWTLVFDPAGRLSYWWSCVVSIAFVYNFWVIVYRFAFDEVRSDTAYVWFTLDYIADLLYFLDIAFHFRTGFLDDGVLQTDSTKLRLHYMNSTVFYVDCLCLLPLDFLYLSIGIISAFRCFRLLKIYRFWMFMDRTERHTNFPNAIRTISLLHYLFAVFHWNACLMYIVMTHTSPADSVNQTTWSSHLPESHDTVDAYLHALYWSTLTLTTIGELPTPSSKPEYVFVIMEFVFGLLLFAAILGHVANIVTNISAARKEFQARLDSVKTYMNLRRVPLRLQDRVIKWFDYLWLTKKSADEEKTLSWLPNKLKAEIALHVHLDTLKRVEIFQNTEAGFLCDLVLRLRPVLFSPGDYICRKGEIGKEMYVVNRGRLQVVADNGRTVLATLRPGSYFGEISVLNMGNAGNRRTASVRSVGYSDLFCLSKTELWEVLQDYPTARVRLEAIAVKRLEKYKKAPVETEGIARSKSTPGLVESSGKTSWRTMPLGRHNTLPPGGVQPRAPLLGSLDPPPASPTPSLSRQNSGENKTVKSSNIYGPSPTHKNFPNASDNKLINSDIKQTNGVLETDSNQCQNSAPISSQFSESNNSNNSCTCEPCLSIHTTSSKTNHPSPCNTKTNYSESLDASETKSFDTLDSAQGVVVDEKLNYERNKKINDSMRQNNYHSLEVGAQNEVNYNNFSVLECQASHSPYPVMLPIESSPYQTIQKMSPHQRINYLENTNQHAISVGHLSDPLNSNRVIMPQPVYQFPMQNLPGLYTNASQSSPESQYYYAMSQNLNPHHKLAMSADRLIQESGFHSVPDVQGTNPLKTSAEKLSNLSEQPMTVELGKFQYYNSLPRHNFETANASQNLRVLKTLEKGNPNQTGLAEVYGSAFTPSIREVGRENNTPSIQRLNNQVLSKNSDPGTDVYVQNYTAEQPSHHIYQSQLNRHPGLDSSAITSSYLNSHTDSSILIRNPNPNLGLPVSYYISQDYLKSTSLEPENITSFNLDTSSLKASNMSESQHSTSSIEVPEFRHNGEKLCNSGTSVELDRDSKFCDTVNKFNCDRLNSTTNTPQINYVTLQVLSTQNKGSSTASSSPTYQRHQQHSESQHLMRSRSTVPLDLFERNSEHLIQERRLSQQQPSNHQQQLQLLLWQQQQHQQQLLWQHLQKQAEQQQVQKLQQEQLVKQQFASQKLASQQLASQQVSSQKLPSQQLASQHLISQTALSKQQLNNLSPQLQQQQQQAMQLLHQQRQQVMQQQSQIQQQSLMQQQNQIQQQQIMQQQNQILQQQLIMQQQHQVVPQQFIQPQNPIQQHMQQPTTNQMQQQQQYIMQQSIPVQHQKFMHQQNQMQQKQQQQPNCIIETNSSASELDLYNSADSDIQIRNEITELRDRIHDQTVLNSSLNNQLNKSNQHLQVIGQDNNDISDTSLEELDTTGSTEQIDLV